MKDLVAAYDAEQRRILAAKWQVRFRDRGMGHGDFGVTTEDGTLIVGPTSQEIAQHIVELHNGQSKTSGRRKTRSKDAKG